MSLRLDMLQAARLAPSLLPDTGESIAGFIHSQFNDDGGAKGRSAESDLYYTVFAWSALAALGIDPPVESTPAFLRSFDDGADLDLVHLTCLARCWAMMPNGQLEARIAARILERIGAHRSADGGFGPVVGGEHGTAYHSFLACGAYQDLGDDLPDRDGVVNCVSRLRTDDGAYANEYGMSVGTTPVTAAAVTLLRELDQPVPREVGDWLLARSDARGGFLAMPNAPMPDLLSTATALHALAILKVSTVQIREATLDFTNSLWTGRAFRGHQADNVEDCEYTFYGLLALGHLSS